MKILKISTLEKGWHDTDEMLLHASFQLLVNFMEKEKPDERIDWSWNAEHRRAWTIISELYDWWKERENRPDPWDGYFEKYPPVKWKTREDGMYESLHFGEEQSAEVRRIGDIENNYYKEDTQKLCQLMRIREYLWT